MVDINVDLLIGYSFIKEWEFVNLVLSGKHNSKEKGLSPLGKKRKKLNIPSMPQSIIKGCDIMVNQLMKKQKSSLRKIIIVITKQQLNC